MNIKPTDNGTTNMQTVPATDTSPEPFMSDDYAWDNLHVARDWDTSLCLFDGLPVVSDPRPVQTKKDEHFIGFLPPNLFSEREVPIGYAIEVKLAAQCAPFKLREV